MRVLVCGSSGCIGSAVVGALRWRGHRVVQTRRSVADGDIDAITLDFARVTPVDDWARQLAALDVDTVVNCAGTPLPGPASPLADRLHGDAPATLFRGAQRAGIARIVTVSALHSDGGDDAWRAKHSADKALLRLDVDGVVVRPSFVYGPGSRSAEAVADLALARIRIVPKRGHALLQPIHVFELAEAIAALVERTGAARGVYEVAGGDVVSCRELLEAMRFAQGADAPHAVSLPMPLARIALRLTRAPTQRLRDAAVLRLLTHAGVAHRNAAPILLGRAPSTFAEGLQVTPPTRSPSSKASRARGSHWLHPSRGAL